MVGRYHQYLKVRSDDVVVRGGRNGETRLVTGLGFAEAMGTLCHDVFIQNNNLSEVVVPFDDVSPWRNTSCCRVPRHLV